MMSLNILRKNPKRTCHNPYSSNLEVSNINKLCDREESHSFDSQESSGDFSEFCSDEYCPKLIVKSHSSEYMENEYQESDSTKVQNHNLTLVKSTNIGSKMMCPLCNKNYTDVHRHIRENHSEVKLDEHQLATIGGYSCNCNGVFSTRKGLLHHIVKYKCIACNNDNTLEGLRKRTQDSVERTQTTLESFQRIYNPQPYQTIGRIPNRAVSEEVQDSCPPPSTHNTTNWEDILLSPEDDLVKYLARLPEPSFKLTQSCKRDLFRTLRRLSRAYLEDPKYETLLPILLIPRICLVGLDNLKIKDKKKRIREYPYGEMEMPGIMEHKPREEDRHNSDDDIASGRKLPSKTIKRIGKLIEDGRISRAQQALKNINYIADVRDPSTVEAIKNLHPQGPTNPFPKTGTRGPRVEREHIYKAVKTFKVDTASGLLGWSVPILKECVKVEEFAEFLQLLANRIANNLAEGRTLMRTSCLTPLRKEKGGIRPIAVGDLIYRLVMKAILFPGRAPNDLNSIQLGVGTIGGVEPAIRMVQRAVEKGEYQGIGLYDFKNAFNNVGREMMANMAYKYNKPMYRTLKWAYNDPSMIVMRGEKNVYLESSQGVRQGDPLGPYGFSLAIREVADRIDEIGDINPLFYLDDLTVACKTKNEYDLITQELLKWTDQGLILHPGKSEFITLDKIRSEGLDILGTHVGNQESTSRFLKCRLDEYRDSIGKLAQLPKHHALSLLKFSTCHLVQHLARTLPPDMVRDQWMEHDNITWDEVQRLRNYQDQEDLVG
jgi:hypothetical protein